MAEARINGVEGAFVDRDGLVQLAACREVAESLHDLAAANADAVDALVRRNNAMNEAGKQYAELAEFQLNELERDRRESELESWTYKGLLALVLIGVAL